MTDTLYAQAPSGALELSQKSNQDNALTGLSCI